MVTSGLCHHATHIQDKDHGLGRVVPSSLDWAEMLTNAVYLTPRSSGAQFRGEAARCGCWAEGDEAQFPRDPEDGLLPGRTSGTSAPIGGPHAAGRAMAQQLGTLRWPQGL